MSLSSKLLEIQRRRIKIFKDKDNPFLKTKYAGIASINERLLPVLNELNIVVNFYHRTDEVGNQYTILQIIDTDTEESRMSELKLKDSTIQELGSNITYDRRYLLISAFNLDTTDDMDDDGQASSTDSKENKPKEWLAVGSPKWQNLVKTIQENKGKADSTPLTLEEIKQKYQNLGIGVSDVVSKEIIKILKNK